MYDSRPKGERERVSLIAAASLGGAMAKQALVVSDTVNKNAFLAFLEFTLLPTLPQGSVLVMGPSEARTQRNNWSVHHGDDVRDLVQAHGCELLYLPTYSPDFNPIEHLFAKVKAFIKRLRPDTTDKLTQAFCDAVTTVTPENVLNAFMHCGYGLEQ